MKNFLALGTILTALIAAPSHAEDWSAIEDRARGQSVNFNAWAGGETINAYIAWAIDQARARYGIEVQHVKITETAEVVRRVQAEKAAGRDQDGSVDVVWINGENFALMKLESLLHGPFTEQLPNMALVAPNLPVDQDFSVPVEGLEAPWGQAQLAFIADSRRVAEPPRSAEELLQFAKDNPGRVTYPRPPAFHGTTFLKQILIETTAEPDRLSEAARAEDFARLTAPLWAYLDELHPHLWRGGKQFPAGIDEMHQMLGDGELMLSMTFNPNQGANLIAEGRLPDTAFSFGHRGGTIGNVHFLAIPYNSPNKDAALVWINFLLSPEAQARKADTEIWGDPSVLATEHLPGLKTAPGALPPGLAVLPEPHATWVPMLEEEWLRRYGG